MKIQTVLLVVLVSTFSACNNSNEDVDSIEPVSIVNPTNKVVLASEIKWTPLNAARGDQSPQAGTLWGDRSADVGTGFLVKFKEGFSSPPHIHNVTYRGVVIKGLIHNDDPNAEKMWMPVGSYWTQPAGEAHITAAKAAENMAFIEIQSGPYLVRPTEQSFDNGERPINVDETNIVWVNINKDISSAKSPKIAYLWNYPNSKEQRGMLVKLPIGFTGKIESEGLDFRAIVVQGQPEYQMPNNAGVKVLKAGSYFSSEGKSRHTISSSANKESVLYIRTNGPFNVTS